MSTAIQKVEPSAIVARPVNPFEPQSLDQAMTLAQTMAKSGLMPSALRNKPADILIVMMAGRELGIGPMQAVQDINVIQGKPVYSADLMVALCKRARAVCEFFRLVEATDERATYETKRVGSPEPERITFTIEDAKKLGLTGRDNYQKQPKTMLRHRAAAALARDVYPDLVRGYDPDEALDFAAPPVDVTPPKSPSQPKPLPKPAEPVVEREPQPAAPEAKAAAEGLAAAVEAMGGEIVHGPFLQSAAQKKKAQELWKRAKDSLSMDWPMFMDMAAEVVGEKLDATKWNDADLSAVEAKINELDDIKF